MTEENKDCCKDGGKCCGHWGKKGAAQQGACGGFYFVAFIGAAVYYLQQVHAFWPGVLAILKAAVWPAMLIHKVFGLIKM
jgi:hypothetical protein